MSTFFLTGVVESLEHSHSKVAQAAQVAAALRQQRQEDLLRTAAAGAIGAWWRLCASASRSDEQAFKLKEGEFLSCLGEFRIARLGRKRAEADVPEEPVAPDEQMERGLTAEVHTGF